MAETAETILSKDVDGGVETVLLDLVARIEDLERRSAGRQAVKHEITHDDDTVDVFRLDPVSG